MYCSKPGLTDGETSKLPGFFRLVQQGKVDCFKIYCQYDKYSDMLLHFSYICTKTNETLPINLTRIDHVQIAFTAKIRCPKDITAIPIKCGVAMTGLIMP